MKRMIIVLALLVLSAGLLAQSQTSASPDVLLKAAMQKEQVDGDLPGALALYTDIVAKFPKDPAAPKALLQMAGIHDRQGRPWVANEIRSDVVRRYPDSEPARVARAELQIEQANGWIERRLDLKTLSYPGSGSVSPDGRFLSLITEDGLAIVDVITGSPRLVVANGDGGYPLTSAWSPDARYVAFAWRSRQGTTELRVVARDAGEARRITSLPGEGDVLDWSADGNTVLASYVVTGASGQPDRQRLVAVSVRSAQETGLLEAPAYELGRAAFSGDDRFVAAQVPDSSGEPSIAIIEVTPSHGPQPLAVIEGNLLDWSPMGELLYLTADGAWAVSIDDGRPEGPPVRITRDPGEVTSLGFTADGQLFVRKALAGPDVYVATIDPTTGRMESPPQLLLTPRPTVRRGPPVWSPDGTRIAYGISGAALTVASLSNQRQRTYDLGLSGVADPTWTPDERSIVFRSADAAGRRGLYQIDLETEDVSFLRPGFRVFYDPSGTSAIYSLGNGPSCCVSRDLRSGLERPFDIKGPGYPTGLSRDGRLLAIFVRASNTIAVMSVDGTSTRRDLIREFPELSSTNVEFSPDGRFVYFVAGPAIKTVWRVPVAGGDAEDTGIRLHYIHDMSLHPDGRRLAMMSTWSPSEIRVWENPRANRAGRAQ